MKRLAKLPKRRAMTFMILALVIVLAFAGGHYQAPILTNTVTKTRTFYYTETITNRMHTSMNVPSFASYNLVGQWNGTEVMTTEPFWIAKSPWTVSWTYKASHSDCSLEIYVYDSKGEMASSWIEGEDQCATNGSGSTAIYSGLGAFQLKIVTYGMESWTVRAYEPK